MGRAGLPPGPRCPLPKPKGPPLETRPSGTNGADQALRMKITFVVPNFNLAGGTRVVAIYADRLRKRGHDVLVVGPDRRDKTARDRLRMLLRGKPGWRGKKRTDLSHFEATGVPCRVLRASGPVTDADVPDADVVIATWWETAEWVAALSPVKGAKAYFLQHHEVFGGQPVDRVEATWKLPLRKITISQWLVDIAHAHGDQDVVLIPNSVETRMFFAEPRGKQPRPTVGLLYARVSTKGCDVSLKALERVAETFPSLRLASFGTVPIDDAFRARLDVDHAIAPPQDQIREIYARCDVWLCGSRSEGFHLPPSEAMACRCPVVSTRIGGSVEIIEDGINGYLVDVDDHEALADRLIRVLSRDEDAWRAMSDAALKTVTRYSWDDATDRFEAALLSTVGEASAR